MVTDLHRFPTSQLPFPRYPAVLRSLDKDLFLAIPHAKLLGLDCKGAMEGSTGEGSARW